MLTIGKYALKKGASAGLSYAKSSAIKVVKEKAMVKAGKAIFGERVGGGDAEVTNQTDFRGLKMFKDPKPTGLLKFFCGSSVIDAKDLDEKLYDQFVQNYDNRGYGIDMPVVERDEYGNVKVIKEVVEAPKDGEVEAPKEGEAEAPKEGEAEAPKQEGGVNVQPEGMTEVSQPGLEALEKKGEEGASEGDGLSEKDVKSDETVNKPITLDDFKRMVTVKKDSKTGKDVAKNKGFVRFVKCDDGKGVTLGKVGNVFGGMMSWRVNVTPEHNRQMRLLFAETLLADFGGLAGVDEAGNITEYGAALQDTLANIKANILNKSNPGEMLERTTVRDCIKEYESLFKEDSLSNIAKSFVTTLLEKQCEWLARKDVDIDKFLGRYGKCSGREFNSLNDVKSYLCNSEITDGKKLKAALAEVAKAFGEMNAVYQQDRAAENFLAKIAKNPTSVEDFCSKGNGLERLKSALLRRLPEVGGDTQNLFFEKKVFSTLVQAYQAKRQARLDAIVENSPTAETERKDADADFLEHLSLDGVVNELKKFDKKLKEKLAKDKDITPLRAVIICKEKELEEAKEGRSKHCEEKKNVNLDDEVTRKFDEKIDRIERELKWLGEREPEFKDGTFKFLDDLYAKVDKKVLDGKNKEEPAETKWTEEALKDELNKGAQKLGEFFQRDFHIHQCLQDACADICKDFKVKNPDLQDILNGVTAMFEDAVNIALAANVRDEGDYGANDFAAKLCNFLLFELDKKGLANDDIKVMDTNPKAEKFNATRSTEMEVVESVVREAVNSAVKRKAESDTSFAEQLETVKEQSEKIVKKLADLFAKIKKDKISGLSSFASGVLSYRLKRGVDELTKNAEIQKYRDAARKTIHINLVQPFIEQDISELFAETDIDKFAQQAEMRLNLRAEESLSALKADLVQQFYEGALHFSTLVEDNVEYVQEVNGKKVVDQKTGYTNTQRVAREFAGALEEFGLVSRLTSPDLKRTSFHALAEKELVTRFELQAMCTWRNDVISRAPGSSYFQIIDKVISIIQDVLKVGDASRFKDINDDWLRDRAADFKKHMSDLVNKYVNFERSLVNACREEVDNVLKDDKRYTSQNKVVRERLQNDLLDKFSGKIGDLLKRFIATPDAFDKAGVAKNLGGMARDMLGLALRGDTNDVKNTDGFKEITEAFGQAIENRETIIAQRTGNDDIRKDVLGSVELELRDAVDKSGFETFRELLKSDDPTLQKAASLAIKWAVDRAVGYAADHPIEMYEDKLSEFNLKLKQRALADLKAIASKYKDLVSSLSQKLTEEQKKIDTQDNQALRDYIDNQYDKSFEDGVESICFYSVAGNSGKKNIMDDMINGKVDGFTKVVAAGVKRSEEIRKEFFENATRVFNDASNAGKAMLLAHGASPAVLGALETEWKKLQDELPKRLDSAIKSLEVDEYHVAYACIKACNDYREDVEKMTERFVKVIDALGVVASIEGIERMLASRNIKREDFPDGDAFNAALKSILTGEFVDLQIEAAQVDVISERILEERELKEGERFRGIGDFSFIDETLVPAFNLQYQIHAARNRVDAQMAEVEEKVRTLAAERGWNDEVVGDVMPDVRNEMESVRKQLDEKIDLENFRDVARSFKPEEVAIDVEKTFAAATERLEKRYARYLEEVARQKWLDANIDKIASRVFSLSPEMFYVRENPSDPINIQINKARAEMLDFIKSSLMANVLSKGGEADWDKTMAGILSKDAKEQMTAEEIDLISPDMMSRLAKITNEYEAQNLDQTKASQGVDTINAAYNNLRAGISSRFDEMFLTYCQPASFYKKVFGSSGKNDEYTRMLAIDRKYADPMHVVNMYKDYREAIELAAGEKTKNNKIAQYHGKTPDPALFIPFIEKYCRKRDEAIESISKRYLEKAMKEKSSNAQLATSKEMDGEASKMFSIFLGAYEKDPGMKAFKAVVDIMLHYTIAPVDGSLNNL